jgi:transposase-like protein
MTTTEQIEWMHAISSYLKPSLKCDCDGCNRDAVWYYDYHGCKQAPVCQSCYDKWLALTSEKADAGLVLVCTECLRAFPTIESLVQSRLI